MEAFLEVKRHSPAETGQENELSQVYLNEFLQVTGRVGVRESVR